MPELLTFVETSVFTKRLPALGLEGSLRGLQLELTVRPVPIKTSRLPKASS